MFIEFEAKFFVDLASFYTLLEQTSAQKIKNNTLMKRIVFTSQQRSGFARVRDEGDTITLSYKTYDPSKTIDSVEELELIIDDFDKGCQMLTLFGFEKLRYAQNYREIWKIDDCLLMIDLWPFLDPIVEIEGNSKESVEKVAKKLNFSMDQARFGPTARLYQEIYSLTQEQFDQIFTLTFDEIPEILAFKG